MLYNSISFGFPSISISVLCLFHPCPSLNLKFPVVQLLLLFFPAPLLLTKHTIYRIFNSYICINFPQIFGKYSISLFYKAIKIVRIFWYPWSIKERTPANMNQASGSSTYIFYRIVTYPIQTLTHTHFSADIIHFLAWMIRISTN